MRQAFTYCTVFAAISCLLTAARIRLLPSAREYSWFSWLLIAWSGLSIFTLVVPPVSLVYFYLLFVVLPISWALYFCTAKYLYQGVFSKYPGIAFAGRSSLWIAASAIPIIIIVSLWLSPGHINKKWEFAMITLLDRCVLFGIAFFLLLLIAVMIRYPISLPQNLAINCYFFGGVLFLQALFQLVNQWSLYHYAALCNTLEAGFDAVLVTAWALALTSAGDTVLIRVRTIKPESEVHLLGQLDALNGILLRAARK